MSTLLLVLSYALTFSFGVLCTLCALTWLDWRVRRGHELRTQEDVTRALRVHETAAQWPAPLPADPVDHSLDVWPWYGDTTQDVRHA